MTGYPKSALAITVLSLLLLAPSATAQDNPAAARGRVGQLAYDSQSPEEMRMLGVLLNADAWHYRCFGLLRLERFTGDEADQAILTALSDEHWQVRCFAIRAAVRKNIDIPAGTFDKEAEPRVIRTAQRAGVPVPLEIVKRYATREIRSNVPERTILGIELAASSGDPQLVSAAKTRTGQLLANMNNTILVTIGDRLAAILNIAPAPPTTQTWQQFLEQNGRNLQFPDFKPQTDAIRAEPLAPIAQFDANEFTAIFNYLDTLHDQDIEIAVVIDGTGSMGHVIQRAQAQTNRLMLTLNDLAKSMKMGVVIYRDHQDRPTVEAHKLNDDVMEVRQFLFQVEAKGGGDFPEAVYDGLSAVYQLGWSREANKQIIIVADAPAHEDTMQSIRGMATQFREGRIPVHTLIVGNNADTVKCLEQIAQWGGGQGVPLAASQDLGKTVMHFAIEPDMHKSFDHFYDLYVDLCM